MKKETLFEKYPFFKERNYKKIKEFKYEKPNIDYLEIFLVICFFIGIILIVHIGSYFLNFLFNAN